MANKKSTKSTKKAAPSPPAPPVEEVKEQVQLSDAAPVEAPPTNQELAFCAIANEIECQRLSNDNEGEAETLAEYIVDFEEAVDDIKATLRRSYEGTDGALDVIRRIGALAVRCLEQNGAPMPVMTDARRLNLLEELAAECPEGCCLDPSLIDEILYY
jgi:hypothetical protein